VNKWGGRKIYLPETDSELSCESWSFSAANMVSAVRLELGVCLTGVLFKV
jgi:hypothetical protein